MTLIRDKNNPYIIMRKDFLEDHNLSWAAKGLFAYAISQPNDSVFPKSCDKVVKELIKHGYISEEGKVL